MRKNFLILLFLLSFLMTGCNKISDSTVRDDFQTYIGADVKIENFEIEKSASEKSQYYAHIYVTYCTDYYRISEYYNVLYYKYNEGWMCEGFSEDRQSRQTVSPISGVPNDVIINSLSNTTISFDDINYEVDEIISSDLKILSQNTSLDSLSDNLTLSFSFEDDYLIYTAEVDTIFNFYDNSWNVAELRVIDISNTLKPEFSCTKSTDELSQAFTHFCKPYKITDLEILGGYVDMPHYQTYNSINYIINTTGIMTYDIATIHAKADFKHGLTYSENWSPYAVDVSVISYENDKLSGTYFANDTATHGTYARELTLALDPNKFGSITGTSNVKYRHKNGFEMTYSCYLKGKINFSTNTINIERDKWITEPTELWYANETMELIFNPTDNSLTKSRTNIIYQKTN